MLERIPVVTKRFEYHGVEKAGLTISSSNMKDTVPPPDVNTKLADLQQKIDRDSVVHGEEVGYIEHEDGEVVDWEVEVGGERWART